MKYIYNVRMAFVACGMLVATSCTDYMDYNTVPQSNDSKADKTLWENISGNDNLTEFADVLKRYHYDDLLSASHTYTVWAPVNGSFNVADMDSAKIERQFLKNAIADYTHRETDVTDTVVYMLNGKLVKFSNKNTSMLAFDGKEILPNEANPDVFNYPSTNGLLYMVSAPAEFRYNGYEYLRESEDMPRMMWAYVGHYESRVLDEANSVKGAIIDGVQHYDDSVMIVSNILTDRMLKAELNNEDSLYTVLIPTDEAWDETYCKVASYYNYVATIPYQDLGHADVGQSPGAEWHKNSKKLITMLGAEKGKTEVALATAPAGAEITETGAYWADSISKHLMTNNFVFSENRQENKMLQTGRALTEKDTLYSTTGNQLTNMQRLDEQTKEVVALSNGHARIINAFPFELEETYAPVIKSRNVGRCRTAMGYNYTQESIDRMVLDPAICVLDDEEETALRYVKTNIPDISTFCSEFNFYLDDVLSTTYDVSLVVVPACVENPEMPDSLRKPYYLYVDINYADYEKGTLTLVNKRFNGETAVSGNSALRKVEPFVAGRDKVDTIPLGRITFPVCYAGTDAKPNIKVMYPFNSVVEDDKSERNLRIANVILEPVKEDEEE